MGGTMRAASRVIVAMALVAGAVIAYAGPAASQAPTTWAITPSANPAGADASASIAGTALVSVACPTATSCFGVGHFTTHAGTSSPFIERSTPSGWVVVPSPNPAGSNPSELRGVACPSPTVCFAVGFRDTSHGNATLIERWNGTTWSVMSSPNKPRWGGRLSAVSCTTTRNCFAVGRYDAALIATLTEHWNGTKWTIVPSPSTKRSPQFETSGYNDLQGVSCASTVSCFAVGSDSDYLYTLSETLIEHWNGTKWSIVPSPNGPGTKYSNLASVSCPSAKSCYAVGDSFATTGTNPAMKTLIVHWDGTSWTRIVTADRVGARRSMLLGVSCTSPTTCTAVGSDSTGPVPGTFTTLTKSLSDGIWSVGSSPNPPAGTYISLNAVACVAPTTCSTVGGYENASSPATLVEQSS